ncbi:MAG: hypothetical protein HY370_06105 [Proteobacteria bacterium]|nr:hypothetical protein [Pseudomonadota bacterium]
MQLLHAIGIADAPDREEFITDVLAADWACYAAPEDKVDEPRLRAVINAFPDGFRLYLKGNKPVGYTGWYPIARAIFDRLHDAPQTLTHRGQIMPLPGLSRGGDYLYLFNYSIIPALHKTPESKAMIQDFARVVRVAPHRGLAAVTVSPDGARVAEKFGMTRRGEMTHDGAPEDVYALRLY